MNKKTDIQKYSVRILLKTDKLNAQGCCPIVIRVTVDRVSAYYFTSHKVAISDWDETESQLKNKATNSQLINASTKKMVSDAERFLVSAQLNNQPVTARQVIDALSGADSGNRDDLLIYWKKLLSDWDGVMNPRTREQFAVDYDKVAGFRKAVLFGDLTPEFLRGFDQYMAKVLKNSENTRWKTFKNFKRVMNLARKDKRTTIYPFPDYEGPRYNQPLPTYLLIEEIRKIEDLVQSGALSPAMERVANYFLLSCYTGFRYGDLKAFSKRTNDDPHRLVLSTQKTGEVVSINRHALLNSVLEKLADRPPVRANTLINKQLKLIAQEAGITKRLHLHVGRHSFGVVGAELGIPIDVMQKLFGHADSKSTKIYYTITNRLIDREMTKWDSLQRLAN